MTTAWAKLTVNFLAFPSMKFRKIWQTGKKYFTLVGTHFWGKSIDQIICIVKRHVDIEGGLQKFLDTRKEGSEKIRGDRKICIL